VRALSSKSLKQDLLLYTEKSAQPSIFKGYADFASKLEIFVSTGCMQ